MRGSGQGTGGKRSATLIKAAALRMRLLLHRYRLVVAGALLAMAFVVGLSWFVNLATSPSRYASKPVALDAYGVSDVEIKIVYPTRLGVREGSGEYEAITVLARALSEVATQPLDLILPPSDESIAFVDSKGTHVPGRLRIVPGYPDALPYDLFVVHGDTQLRSGLLRSHRVNILPMVKVDQRAIVVPELAFQMHLESYWGQTIRTFSASVVRVGTPYLVLGSVVAVVAWAWVGLSRQQRLAREERLLPIYSRLREHIELARWQDARGDIQQIGQLQSNYRDVDELDTLVTVAETAARRRQHLYSVGVQAYESRDWPSAVQAFSAVEKESPFYRDVRFLRRTAALYADLGSRDRSRRITAAQELGQVADLMDAMPLLLALGDRSREVADAAEESFRRIGVEAFDVLLAGLADGAEDVRQRIYRLIGGYGQEVRERLLGALRSSNPRITRPVARLLVALGARQEVADALLWAPATHQEGIVEALQGEGMAASGALIDVLLKAPPERQQVLINALAAVKMKADIDRRIAEALRAAKGSATKEILQRALRAPAAPFRVAGSTPEVRPLPAGRHTQRLESGARHKRR